MDVNLALLSGVCALMFGEQAFLQIFPQNEPFWSLHPGRGP